MPSDPTFISFYGNNATQNLTTIIINKEDLKAPLGINPSYTFTPEESNRAESLALAQILRWQRNQDQSQDSQFIISPFEQNLEFRFGKWMRGYRCTIEIWHDDNENQIPNPNNI